MAQFRQILKDAASGKVLIQGNAAFALGIIHAEFDLADGYPGTPSTEVLQNLQQVPDLIIADWSINEAVAVGLGTGHSMAGKHSVVTMKLPGLFQAADVVAAAAHTRALEGALVLFVATDHLPSSSQYIVDSRPFLESLMIPIIEPRNHQELYECAKHAKELSVRWKTPVVVLCSSVLCHAESFVTATPPSIKPIKKNLPADFPRRPLIRNVLLPADARNGYDYGLQIKIPGVARDVSFTAFLEETDSESGWGIICAGAATLIVLEVLERFGLRPKLLSFSCIYPPPYDRIISWKESVAGPVFLFEDGGRFIESHFLQKGISVIAKNSCPTVTHWNPDLVLQLLRGEPLVAAMLPPIDTYSSSYQECVRPPAICAGCPYRAISLEIQALKRRKKLDLVFGDIGCSTLLHFQNSLDINLCMGASESMRQGYILANPECAGKVISLIGDSCECHSGMDATRNAIFRNIPGVKIILDNKAVAMTGAQKTPTSLQQSEFDLSATLQSQGFTVFQVNAYRPHDIKKHLETALSLASSGAQCVLIVEGECLAIVPHELNTRSKLTVDTTKCIRCGLCNICPAIEFSQGSLPVINSTCSLCGSGYELCVQTCPHQALYVDTAAPTVQTPVIDTFWLQEETVPPSASVEVNLPEVFRMVTCGVGGQGNLFFGKLLAEVIRPFLQSEQNLILGEIHGMAQKGGTVSSTFGFGRVHSPIFSSGSVDLLVGMERNELCRKQYLQLLRPEASIIYQDLDIKPRQDASSSLGEAYGALPDIRRWRCITISPQDVQDTKLKANVFLLGVVANMEPFVQIPLLSWETALRSLSKTPGQFITNSKSFYAGKNHSTVGMTDQILVT